MAHLVYLLRWWVNSVFSVVPSVVHDKVKNVLFHLLISRLEDTVSAREKVSIAGQSEPLVYDPHAIQVFNISFNRTAHIRHLC
jgi:hypothetical protein